MNFKSYSNIAVLKNYSHLPISHERFLEFQEELQRIFAKIAFFRGLKVQKFTELKKKSLKAWKNPKFFRFPNGVNSRNYSNNWNFQCPKLTNLREIPCALWRTHCPKALFISTPVLKNFPFLQKKNYIKLYTKWIA